MLDPLKQLARIQKERIKLRDEYNHYIKLAAETGYSNSKIAHELKVSETAIRLYRKRNKL